MDKQHFDNKFIDEIVADPQDNYFTKVLDYALDKSSPNTVCDIGCGNGVFTGSIKNKCQCELIGLDSNAYALEQASKLGFDQLFQVKDFSKDKLPIASNSVDLVICKDVMEHLIDPLNLTSEIFRVAKPGGAVLLHVPNHFPIWGRLKFLFTNNIDTFSYFPGAYRYDFPHIRFFTLSDMRKMLQTSGFSSVENISWFFAKPPIIHRVMPNILIRKLAQMSTDNYSEGITVLAYKA